MVPIASIILVTSRCCSTTTASSTRCSRRSDGTRSTGSHPAPASLLVIVILFLWKNLGYNAVLFWRRSTTSPKAMLEAAENRGASEWTQFVHINPATSRRRSLFVTILSIINSFKGIPRDLSSDGQLPMTRCIRPALRTQHVPAAGLSELRGGVPLAIGVVILIAIFFAVEIFFESATWRDEKKTLFFPRYTDAAGGVFAFLFLMHLCSDHELVHDAKRSPQTTVQGLFQHHDRAATFPRPSI